jgi:hypothetical protein
MAEMINHAAVQADLIPANDGAGYHCFIIRLPPWLDARVERYRQRLSRAAGTKVSGADACRLLLERATRTSEERSKARAEARAARSAQLPIFTNPRNPKP